MKHRSKYDKARGYAYRLDSENSRDLVHTAYIKHYDKTGGNMFDETMHYICWRIKMVWLTNYKKSITRNHENTQSRYVKMDEDYFDNIPTSVFIEENIDYQTFIGNFITNISVSNTKNETKETLFSVLALCLKGYRQVDIRKELNMSQQTVNLYIKRLRQLYNDQRQQEN
jgi:hypothetical protein